MIFQGCGNPDCPCMAFDGKSDEDIMNVFSSGSTEEKVQAVAIIIPVVVRTLLALQEQHVSLSDSVDALGNKVGQLMTRPTSGEN